ncbi:MAG TPA: hypothetical protein PLA25_14490 [Anaerolineaceae bacterium]|nr:hypothetical protein [Anaerolineaceae bacterium]HQN45342.1 hypothetical protein [Anaerolineaceae bacterium]
MSEQTPERPYPVGSDEKVNRVMVYTSNAIYWGDVVAKEAVRVSTWLRTNSAPEFLRIYQARCIVPTAGATPRPLLYTEIYIPATEIRAYHLMAPDKDPLDYDPTEPNRRMDPVSVVVGTFRIDGHLRVSAISNLGKYLEITREAYTPLYDVEITNLIMPALGVMKTYYIQVRQSTGLFGILPQTA